MGLSALLAFAPFIAFAVIENFLGTVAGLASGFGVSVVLIYRHYRHGARELNILESGSALMFGGLTLLALTFKRGWTVWEVRLWVDCGLVLVVLASIALRRPFTLQHARKVSGLETASSASLLKAANVIAGVWALAFAALAAIDFYMMANPQTPTRRGVLLTLATLAVAAKCTQSLVKKAQREFQGTEER